MNSWKALFLLGIFNYSIALAQPNANFTASITTGCAPLSNVQFSDQSTGSPTSWVWKKNGSQFSTLQNPSTSFPTAGTYTISLTATNSSGSSTKNMTITVYGNPTADFSASGSTAGCLPHRVQFSDNSSPNGSSIVSRLWSFGDGGQSTLTNPSHEYSLAGKFPVSLKVVDARGCENTKQKANFVEVYTLPAASFGSNSTRLTCKPPLTVAFNNNSSGTGNLTYFWDFGDGNTSSSATPSNTYNNYGVFDVTLVVTDGNGCKDTLELQDFVRIQAISAGISLIEDSVCFGDSVQLVQNSTGAVAYFWDFGDNTSDVGASVWHTYQDSGWHTVRMIASVSGSGCKDTAYVDVYTQQVVADFTVSPRFICELDLGSPPTVVRYSNNSINGDTSIWYRGYRCPHLFPPGKTCHTGEGQDTVLVYNGAGNHWRGVRDIQGVFRDTLVTMSNLGCVDTMVMDSSFIVNLVRSGPVLSDSKGCRPYNIDFTYADWAYDPSISVPNPIPTITNYAWFIDDTLYSTLKSPPTLNLTDTGNWIGYLAVENSYGCRDTAEFTFQAGDKPTASFTVVNDTVCASDFDTVISTSQDTNFINDHGWKTKPNAFIGYADERRAFFDPIDTGWHEVTHWVGHNGCYDTITVPQSFYVNGPIVEISSSLFNCVDSTRIQFWSLMKAADKWIWDFGDSTIPFDTINAHPVVNYSKQGLFWPKLTAYSSDSGCMDSDQIPVMAGVTKAMVQHYFIPPDPMTFGNVKDTINGCLPLTLYFSSYRAPGVLITDWIIDGNLRKDIPPDSLHSYTFNQRGYYNVTVIGYDTIAGCVDTSHSVVAVHMPVLDFIGNPSQGCSPLNVSIEENVSSMADIKQYYWEVGTDVDSGAVFQRTYGQGNKDVQLVAVDEYGCKDTLVKKDFITISSFSIYFYGTGPREFCSGDSIGFLETQNPPNVKYTWYFGDGDSSNLPSPNHVYLDSGKFTVTLKAEDSSGCIQEHVRSEYITVQASPNADFWADKTDSNCYPLPVQFTADTNINYYDENDYFWTLGDLSAASNFKNPFYNYVRPGNYTVTLIVTTTFGCSDTIVKPDYIKVRGPYAEVSLSDDSICRGDSIVYQMTTAIDVVDFSWDFGDGNVVSNVNPAVNYYTDSVGLLFPNLVVSDSINGCAQSFQDTIYVFQTEALFDYSDSAGCVPFDPGFYNRSVDAEQFFWDFGDGGQSSSKHPDKVYNNEGTYMLELRVSNTAGCSDTIFQTFVVHPLPIASAEPDTLICEGDSVQLFADGGVLYAWTPGAVLNDDSIQDPFAYPLTTTDFEVVVIDSNSCENMAQTRVLVQNPIYVNLPDLSKIVGDTVTLSGYAGDGLTYKWVPPDHISCDTCPNPLLTALVEGEYTLIITDTNGCFEAESKFNLEIQDKYTLDVPSAFTPNGDGVNDVVYVRGWGIKELVTFKIFNRWGELIFESNDLDHGWDGTYKGRIQDVETYVYYVEAITYGDDVLTKKGNINLIK